MRFTRVKPLNRPVKRWVCEHTNKCRKEVSPVVAVHGGADNYPYRFSDKRLAMVKVASRVGFCTLEKTGSVLEAVEAAIKVLEEDENFNAGRGSVLTRDGEVFMDAQISEGKNLKCGAVTMVRRIVHPISVAKLVLEKSPYCFLGGEGAEDFIEEMCVPRIAESALITDYNLDLLNEHQRAKQFEIKTGGTVGCVVVGKDGHVASGTSTGGLVGKPRGRIGDSPMIGCGGYSDNRFGAVSVTGSGEHIMRFNLSYRILQRMKKDKSPKQALKKAIKKMSIRVGGFAGAICVSPSGETGVYFSSETMPWAIATKGIVHSGIEPEDHYKESF